MVNREPAELNELHNQKDSTPLIPALLNILHAECELCGQLRDCDKQGRKHQMVQRATYGDQR